MTPKEAIDIINDVSWEHNGRHYGKISPARELAISALAKQIPKEENVNGIRDGREINTVSYTCPVCHNHIGRDAYYKHCGQKLEWGGWEMPGIIGGALLLVCLIVQIAYAVVDWSDKK